MNEAIDKMVIAFGVAILCFMCVGGATCGALTAYERIQIRKSDNAREVMHTCLRYHPFDKCAALRVEMSR